MTSADVHVDPVNECASIAVAKEAIRQASAAAQECLSAQAGAENEQRQAQGAAEADMLTEAAADATGLGGVMAAVGLADQRYTDNAEARDIETTGAQMGASNPVSFEGGFQTAQPQDDAFRSIKTDSLGPTFTEQFTSATMTFASLKEDMSGAKASEDICDDLNAIAECKMMTGLANAKVMQYAQQLVASAPAFGGSGGQSIAINKLKSEQEKLEEQQWAEKNAHLMKQPTQPPQAVTYAYKEPELGLNNFAPKPPSSDMLTEEGEALA